MAYNPKFGPTGTGFDVRYKEERFVGKWVPLLGKHHLYNVLAALAVGTYYDVPIDEALRSLSDVKALPGRMNILEGINGSILVDDSYSANLQSTMGALEWLKIVTQATDQRAIFVMGDMETANSNAQRANRALGKNAAEFIGRLVTEGIEAAQVGRAALDEGMEGRSVSVTYSVEDAVSALQREGGITANDVVLIKGGMAARMELVTQALLKNPQDSMYLPRQNFSWQNAGVFQPTHHSWIELDMAAFANNVRLTKQRIGQDVTLMACVKSDAYGHGLVQCASTALVNGATYLAVSSVAEALQLRESGITAPILVLNYTPVYAVRQAIRQNITLVVYDLEMARAYDRAARELGGKLRVHVKVDTGMGRLGIAAGDAAQFFRHLVNLRHLEIEGIYSHFSSADIDARYTAEQLQEFREALKPLRASGFSFKYTHIANTAGLLRGNDYYFNMVRIGLGLYGLHPSEELPMPAEYKPVLSWKTVVAQVRSFPEGSPIGYHNTYRTRREDEKIAIIPIGYADGFRRGPQTWRDVLIHGVRAPLVGRVSMEKAAVNVSHIPNVSIGDEVVLLGQQGDQVITAEEIAQQLGTSNYEVVTSILPRVPRR
jgi:Alr-MurF fusion protein